MAALPWRSPGDGAEDAAALRRLPSFSSELVESARHAQTRRHSPVTSLAKFTHRVVTLACALRTAWGAWTRGSTASASERSVGCGPAGRGPPRGPAPAPSSGVRAARRVSPPRPAAAPTSSRPGVGGGGWPPLRCGVALSGQTAPEELAHRGRSLTRVPVGVTTGSAGLRGSRPCRGLESQVRVLVASSRLSPAASRGAGLPPPLRRASPWAGFIPSAGRSCDTFCLTNPTA